jgi:hypothetical protein
MILPIIFNDSSARVYYLNKLLNEVQHTREPSHVSRWVSIPDIYLFLFGLHSCNGGPGANEIMDIFFFAPKVF